MSLSLAEIQRVVEELRPRVVGGRLDNATQSGPSSLILTFHAHRAKQHLLIATNPQFARLHLTAERPPGTGDVPPFARSVRQGLRGGWLREINVLGADRVVELVFGSVETPAGRLVAELTGRTSNLYHVGPAGRIVAALRPVGKGERDLSPGSPYAPPAGRPGGAPSGSDRFADAGSPGEAIEEHYAAAEAAERTRTLRASLAAHIRAARKKAERLVANLEGDVVSRLAPEQLRLCGELLKAHLNQIAPRAESVSLPNLFEADAPEVEIALQPGLSPRQNMERYFRRYKKLVDARRQAAERAVAARRRLDALDASAIAVEEAATLGELEALAARLGHRVGAARPKQRPVRAQGPLRFLSADGMDILVARSARENDELTFRIARGSDLWLHVEGYTGSHVVVRVPRGKTVPLERLLDAATLAVHYSELRRAGGGPVVYCPRKHVTKPRDAAAGQVLYSQNRTLHVIVERERLDRLLSGRGEPRTAL
ncbi:MAG TPA: NFACT family protein [Planctomycetota bacterium]|nr:NFACT family protein [Planctomycetota bacterium]